MPLALRLITKPERAGFHSGPKEVVDPEAEEGAAEIGVRAVDAASARYGMDAPFVGRLVEPVDAQDLAAEAAAFAGAFDACLDHLFLHRPCLHGRACATAAGPCPFGGCAVNAAVMPQDPPSPFHFQTSQPRELLACVEFAARQAERVAEDPGAFRWLSISMVLAVQNACLSALDHGDEYGTKGMSRTHAREVKRWTKRGRSGPEPQALREPRIVSPMELLRRTGDSFFLRPPFQLPLNREINEAFDDLNDLRNTFLHFSEDGWTIDLREIPPLMLVACSIVRHLSVTQPIYLRQAERNHRERVAAALDRIEAAMEHYPGMG